MRYENDSRSFLHGFSGQLIKRYDERTLFLNCSWTGKEQAQLAGGWKINGGVVHVAFRNNGIPWLAEVDWKNNGFVLRKSRIYFTKHNDSLYVFVPTEPDKTSEHVFAEMKPPLDGEGINIWGPDAAYFGELVENGQLKGSVKKDEHSMTMKLETPAMEILEFIATNHAALDDKNPLLYQKLD